MNDLSFTQISTILNSITKQATGQSAITPTNTGEFTAVAQTALLSGYDNVLNAISQVLSRTIFSIRPYYRKLAGLQVSNQRFGNHVRKLQALDKDFENDERQPLTDGASVDMFKVNKPDVLQTNFYGQAAYQKHITIFRDQLDVAFSSPEEFGRFITMIMQNASDQIEQAHESLARGCMNNLIGGIVANDNDEQIVHMLTEYNTATGQAFTPVDIVKPDNYGAFIKWAYARVATISSMLTERTTLYHQNIADKDIPRHTPYQMQKVYLYAPTQFEVTARVLADTFHENFLKLADNDAINFFQSAESPNSIDVTATYMDESGTLKTSAQKVNNIFGIIADEEALGYTVINQWSAPTPFNAAGGYSNLFWHFTDRYWNDFTENAVLFLMD